MKKLVSLVLIFALTTSLVAEEIYLKVGEKYIKITGENIKVEEIKVRTLKLPVEPVKPDPNLSKWAKDLQKALPSGLESEAEMMGAVCHKLSEQKEDPEIVYKALKFGWKEVGNQIKFKKVRDIFNQQHIKLLQEGVTAEKYAQFLKEAALAFGYSKVGGKQGFDIAKFVAIMKLVMALIEELKELKKETKK